MTATARDVVDLAPPVPPPPVGRDPAVIAFEALQETRERDDPLISFVAALCPSSERYAEAYAIQTAATRRVMAAERRVADAPVTTHEGLLAKLLVLASVSFGVRQDGDPTAIDGFRYSTGNAGARIEVRAFLSLYAGIARMAGDKAREQAALRVIENLPPERPAD